MKHHASLVAVLNLVLGGCTHSQQRTLTHPLEVRLYTDTHEKVPVTLPVGAQVTVIGKKDSVTWIQLRGEITGAGLHAASVPAPG